MTRTEPFLHPERPRSVYKWMSHGAVNQDCGFEWAGGPGTPAAPPTAPRTAVYGYATAGLPYEIDDELWEVVLEDVLGYAPFPHQATNGGHRYFLDDEQRLFALRGRLMHRVHAWTDEVAEEFARECALQARGRALQALYSATQVLEKAQAVQDAPIGPEAAGSSGVGTRSSRGNDAEDEEAVVLHHADRLLSIWSAARQETGSPAQVASAYAAAVAASRSFSAFTYAATIGSSEIDAERTAARAYADERRRQARWLQDRLGLQELDDGPVGWDVAHQEGRKDHATLSGM